MGGFRSRIAVVSFYGIDSVICEVPKQLLSEIGQFLVGLGHFWWFGVVLSHAIKNGIQWRPVRGRARELDFFVVRRELGIIVDFVGVLMRFLFLDFVLVISPLGCASCVRRYNRFGLGIVRIASVMARSHS